MPILLLLIVLQDPSIVPAWEAELGDLVGIPPVTHGNLVITTSRFGLVEAFKLDTGEPAWSVTHKASISAGPIVFKDKLFLPGWHTSATLDPATGAKLKDGPSASQAVVGPYRMYLLKGMQFNEQFELHSSDTVRGFDPLSGRVLWEEEMKPSISMAIEVGGRLIVTSQGKVMALSTSSGKKQAEATVESMQWPFHGKVHKERLIFVAEGLKSVFCINSRTLKEHWSVKVGGMLRDIEPLVIGDQLILFPLPEVVALDVATGKEEWRFNLGGVTNFSLAPPAVRGTEVIVGSRGKLMAFDVKAGAATWSLAAGAPEKDKPVPQPVWIGDRLLYVVGTKLYCFKLR